MQITLPGDVVRRFPRFSLYNSPYPAHRRGRAVDLYLDERRDAVAPSPVAGEVLATRSVRSPARPYAARRDHLLLIETVDGAITDGRSSPVARVLHVDPVVEAGDHVDVGDPLGRTVRSGFFAPWVADHLHLGFREPDADLYRARGSLPLSLDVAMAGVPWDGTGEVVATGDTYAVLDAPDHPGDGYAAVATDEGVPLDGGLVHYAGGGALGGHDGAVSLLGTVVGDSAGRDVAWRDVAVRAARTRVTGLSFAASRDRLGAKLVARDHDLSVGDRVEVTIVRTDDPVRLG